MRKAFVTGGTGFLGRRLVEQLVEQGWSVRALHRSPKDAERLRALGAEPIEGDLDTEPALRRGMAGADVVFHSAALFVMWAPYADFEHANVDGTRNLLAAAKAEQIKRFVQIGASGVVMGDPKPMNAVTEDAPLAYPSWAPYLSTKARAQELVLRANEPDGMRTTVVLPSLIWGPQMPMLKGVIDAFKAGLFAWPGGGQQVMSTSYVDNVCRCAILAAEHAPGGRSYFVTDGEDQTLREIIGQLVATEGVDPKARAVPAGLAWFLATVMEWVWRTFKLRGAPPMTRQQVRMTGYTFTLSDQRARTELGYAPVVSFQGGIDAMRLATQTESARSLPQQATAPLRA
jgi:nucleoside-diphosphate-sugar epimerase